VKRLLVILFVVMTIGCITVRSVDGLPVVQAPVAGGTLSCKSTRCCWPWDNEGRFVVCIEPLAGNYMGAGGIMVTVRGKVP
jgi:hypothetical protein